MRMLRLSTLLIIYFPEHLKCLEGFDCLQHNEINVNIKVSLD